MDLTPTIELLRAWAEANEYIRALYIYGSRARDDFRNDSDLDVALVIRPGVNDANEMSVFAFEKQGWLDVLQPRIPFRLHIKALHPDSPDVQAGVDRSSILVYEEGK